MRCWGAGGTGGAPGGCPSRKWRRLRATDRQQEAPPQPRRDNMRPQRDGTTGKSEPGVGTTRQRNPLPQGTQQIWTLVARSRYQHNTIHQHTVAPILVHHALVCSIPARQTWRLEYTRCCAGTGPCGKPPVPCPCVRRWRPALWRAAREARGWPWGPEGGLPGPRGGAASRPQPQAYLSPRQNETRSDDHVRWSQGPVCNFGGTFFMPQSRHRGKFAQVHLALVADTRSFSCPLQALYSRSALSARFRRIRSARGTGAARRRGAVGSSDAGQGCDRRRKLLALPSVTCLIRGSVQTRPPDLSSPCFEVTPHSNSQDHSPVPSYLPVSLHIGPSHIVFACSCVTLSSLRAAPPLRIRVSAISESPSRVHTLLGLKTRVYTRWFEVWISFHRHLHVCVSRQANPGDGAHSLLFGPPSARVALPHLHPPLPDPPLHASTRHRTRRAHRDPNDGVMGR